MNKPGLLILLVLALCCGSFSALAQDRKAHFALIGGASIKYPFLGDGSRNYNLFGVAGSGVACLIVGSTEGSLSFLPKLSLVRENTAYHNVSSVKYVIETVNVLFNPEILIPTRNERWKIAAGIGVDWMVDMTVAEYWTDRNAAGTNIEAVYDTIYAARKPLVPFVSGGVLFQALPKFHLQLSLAQDLVDAYHSETVVTFNNGNAPLTVNLSHMPTRLGLGIMYVF